MLTAPWNEGFTKAHSILDRIRIQPKYLDAIEDERARNRLYENHLELISKMLAFSKKYSATGWDGLPKYTEKYGAAARAELSRISAEVSAWWSRWSYLTKKPIPQDAKPKKLVSDRPWESGFLNLLWPIALVCLSAVAIVYLLKKA